MTISNIFARTAFLLMHVPAPFHFRGRDQLHCFGNLRDIFADFIRPFTSLMFAILFCGKSFLNSAIAVFNPVSISESKLFFG